MVIGPTTCYKTTLQTARINIIVTHSLCTTLDLALRLQWRHAVAGVLRTKRCYKSNFSESSKSA